MSEWFAKLKADFILNFIDGDRWKWLVEGLGKTLLITLFATLIGVVIGVIIAAVRSTYDKNEESFKKEGGLKFMVMWLLNAICNLYLTVIRGTPVVVQLLITYNIIFAWSTQAVLVGMLGFGLNSGAYVAEIMRGGINAVDIGQTEAGRALGLNYGQTMLRIVLPQAIKNVVPTLGNEFIALLKETSVVSFITVVDLTKAFQNIANSTYEYIIPYIVLALVYFVVVFAVTGIVKVLERRLRASDKR